MANGQWYEDATSVQVRQWATLCTVALAVFLAATWLGHARAWRGLLVCAVLIDGVLWLICGLKVWEERKDAAWHRERFGPRGKP
jgi:hypothetical protein